ncbi:MAG: hypothetical protein U9P00_10760, partial [Pseudomonadota bacterium]|nr:hypothetical protein [Pseudomonadota bacterium]
MYRNIRNNLYYIYFSIIKYFKHPTCKIHSNNIHPSAKLGKHLCIEKYIKIGKEVEIGDYTYINEYT